MKRFFEIISVIFSPLIVASYGMALSLWLTPIYMFNDLDKMLKMVGVVACITALFPLAILVGLCRTGLIKGGLDVPDRRERLMPYMAEMVCMLLCLLYLYNAAAPWWLTSFMVGGLVAVAINCLVNYWWKISGHMAGMGALMGLVLSLSVCRVASSPNMLAWTVAMAMACGLVAAARLYLHKHTPLQVLAGFANGLLCVTVVALIW